MSDIFWQAFFGTIVTIVVTWLQIRTKKAVDDATAAAKHSSDKVDAVKLTLDTVQKDTKDKLTALTKVTDTIHDLSNSNYEVQLILNANLSREKSDRTGLQVDIEAADLAEKKLKEHRAKQSIVDAKVKSIPERERQDEKGSADDPIHVKITDLEPPQKPS